MLKKFFKIFFLLLFAFLIKNNVEASTFVNFDDFPVTPIDQEATSSPTWTKGYTQALADIWTSKNGYPAPDQSIKNSFNAYINTYNTDHMGWENFGYLQISDKAFVSGGKSLEFVTTGGKNSTNINGAGISIRNKGQFLQAIIDGIDPYADVPVGQQYVYFLNNSSSGSFKFFPEASTADQLTMYVYYPVELTVGTGGTGVPPKATMNIGPFTGQAGSHWYHRYYINGGGWIKLYVDNHPQHNNSFNQASDYPYPSSSMRNMDPADYMQQFYRFYFASGGQVNAIPPYSVYFDEIEFSNTSTEQQNFETIASPAIMMKQDKSWEISLNDKYVNNANSSSTYQVKYSFSPITNANFESAKSVLVNANPGFNILSRNDGKFQKWWAYYSNTWVSYRLESVDEENILPGVVVYFAIKDIGNLDNSGIPTQIPNNSLTGTARKGGRAYDTFASSFDWAGDQLVLLFARFIEYKVPEASPSVDFIAPSAPSGLSVQ